MQYVNQPVMNEAQTIRLRMTKKYIIVEKADIIPKKDIDHKKIKSEEENLQIGSPQYQRKL